MNTLETQIIEARQQSITYREQLEEVNKKLRAEQERVRQLEQENDEAGQQSVTYREQLEAANKKLRAEQARVRQLEHTVTSLVSDVRKLEQENDEAFEAVRNFKDAMVSEQQQLRESPSQSFSRQSSPLRGSVSPPPAAPESTPSRQETFHSVHTHFSEMKTFRTDAQDDTA